ncbi:hypothetical protein AAFF_G00363720 [Aldrovandia affinis]|uniref:Uncharacterized protein n=1 Tax=Aldrovandia affinis TaxID=143900 RepID=A0AAD7SHZ4_9TELE|nr:hypothetical protein AAFF_G00363720 [Aldrovandia affinis]
MSRTTRMRKKRMVKAPPHCFSPQGVSCLRAGLSLREYVCWGDPLLRVWLFAGLLLLLLLPPVFVVGLRTSDRSFWLWPSLPFLLKRGKT